VLELAPSVETEFVERDRALAQIAEWAEKSTRFPVNLLSCGCHLRLVAAMLWGTTSLTSMFSRRFHVPYGIVLRR